MSKNNLGLAVHGVALSEAWDTSGEKILLNGVDDSALKALTGVFNFEHKNEHSGTIVGKVLESKKIFKESDCENKHHKLFFDKNKQKPYLYVRGVLFDIMGHLGAQEVAAILRFDQAANLGDSAGTLGLSIEGGRLQQKDGVVEKCIARKIAITCNPCNKAAIMRILDDSDSEPLPQSETDKLKSLLQSVFKKSEEEYQDLAKGNDLKSPATKQIIDNRKEGGLKTQDKYQQNIGQAKMAVSHSTSPTKPVTSTSAPVISGSAFRDKIEAARKNKTPASEQSQVHTSAPKEPSNVTSIKGRFPEKIKKSNNMRSSLLKNCKAGNDALAVENLDKKMYKSISDEIYSRFDKKEELLSIIETKYPELNKSDMIALAKTTTYAMEKRLEDELMKSVGQVEFTSLPKMRSRPESDVKMMHSPFSGDVAAHSAANKASNNTKTKLSNKTISSNKEAVNDPNDHGMSFRSHNKKGIAGSPTNIAHLGSNEGVKHHEALHGTFSNLSNKHGLNQQQMGSVHNHLLNMIHPHDIHAIKAHMVSNGYDENSPTHHEEILAHVHQALEGGNKSDSKLAEHKQAKRAGEVSGEKKPTKFGTNDYNKTRLRDSWNLIREHAKGMDEGKLNHIANSNVQPDYKSYKKSEEDSDDEPENLPKLLKPFKSEAQKKFMYANPEVLGEVGLKEWQSKTDESKLPKKLNKK